MASRSTASDTAVPPVAVYSDFLDDRGAARWLRWCLAALPWRQDRVRMFGREHACPRLVAFLAEPGLSYRYSGFEHRGSGLGTRLSALLAAVNARLSTRFNSVLVTCYRDGADRLGWHADRERELGPDPELAVLSLGAPRTLAFRTRVTPRQYTRYPLTAGSLLFMGPGTQAHWQHSVPPQQHATERVSLGFRELGCA